jgi:hypothetical protein
MKGNVPCACVYMRERLPYLPLCYLQVRFLRAVLNASNRSWKEPLMYMQHILQLSMVGCGLLLKCYTYLLSVCVTAFRGNSC